MPRRRRCLQIEKPILVDVIFNQLLLGLPQLHQIRFVAHQHHSYPRLRVILQLSQPFLNIFKRFWFGKVESYDGTHCAPIVRIGNGSESLLPGGIPDLIFDALAVDVGSFGREFYSDGRFGVHGEGVVDESGEEVGLADSWVSDHDYFEELVEFLLLGHFSNLNIIYCSKNNNLSREYPHPQSPAKTALSPKL